MPPRLYFLLLILIPSLLNGQYDVFKMDYPVNTDLYDEICPVLSYEENELFFTRVASPDFETQLIENGIDQSTQLDEEKYRKRLRYIYTQIAGQSVKDPVASSFNQDVWFAKYAQGEVYNTFHPGPPLNNALPNSICSQYGADGGYVVINQFDPEGGMSNGFSYVERTGKLSFSQPKAIVIADFDLFGSAVNLTMSRDKTYIIIAMEKNGSKTGKDLYLSTKIKDGLYAQPKRLGDGINTPYDESTPYLSKDNKRLYFASNRPGGIGKMDIYKSERLDFTYRNWTSPENLGTPLNSPEDDGHPFLLDDDAEILFTSTRDGSSDIYYGKFRYPEQLNYTIVVNVKASKEDSIRRIPSEMEWGLKYEEDYTEYFRSRDGYVRITFKDNNLRRLRADARGYIGEEIDLDPMELRAQSIKEVDIILTKKNRKKLEEDQPAATVKTKKAPEKLAEGVIPLEVNSTVVLKNIYFAQGTADVLKKSYPAVKKLAETLISQPTAIIRIEGHTDNVGDKQALLELSQNRAEAIKQLLVKEGVDAGQIKTKGYGDTRPITLNRSEKEKSQNRRVEISVLKQ